jgi:uncharacterized Zn-finger protein|nr:zinc-finger domain-containing protein [uncultured Dongia sp.]
MEPIETEIVTKTRIACDGGGDPSGHPRVFLNLGKDGHVDCPYCGKHFVLQEGASAGAH